MKVFRSVLQQIEKLSHREFVQHLGEFVWSLNPADKQKDLFRIFQALFEVNPCVIDKWTQYAACYINYLRSQGFRIDEEPRSIVHSIISSIILLDRQWPMNINLTFLMKRFITSELNNIAKHSKVFIQGHPCRIMKEDEEEGTDILSGLPGLTLQEIYDRQDNKEIIAECRSILASHKYPVLLQIFDGILEGKSSKELSKELAMPVHKILNMRRLFIKHLRKHFHKNKGQENEK